jgi:hypothetical protein
MTQSGTHSYEISPDQKWLFTHSIQAKLAV